MVLLYCNAGRNGHEVAMMIPCSWQCAPRRSWRRRSSGAGFFRTPEKKRREPKSRTPQPRCRSPASFAFEPGLFLLHPLQHTCLERVAPSSFPKNLFVFSSLSFFACPRGHVIRASPPFVPTHHHHHHPFTARFPHPHSRCSRSSLRPVTSLASV